MYIIIFIYLGIYVYSNTSYYNEFVVQLFNIIYMSTIKH